MVVRKKNTFANEYKIRKHKRFSYACVYCLLLKLPPSTSCTADRHLSEYNHLFPALVFIFARNQIGLCLTTRNWIYLLLIVFIFTLTLATMITTLVCSRIPIISFPFCTLICLCVSVCVHVQMKTLYTLHKVYVLYVYDNISSTM